MRRAHRQTSKLLLHGPEDVEKILRPYVRIADPVDEILGRGHVDTHDRRKPDRSCPRKHDCALWEQPCRRVRQAEFADLLARFEHLLDLSILDLPYVGEA